MPRPLRENIEGGIYHVYARGNDGCLVYRDDFDRLGYLRLLGSTVVSKRWSCLAYCLMSTHLHLLLETPQADLSSGMQRIQGVYAQTFNARHDRRGHLFQDRYGAVRIESSRQLCAAAGYIARNPVDAGICRRPDEWQWSSFGPVVRQSAPNWLDAEGLLAYFAPDAEYARSQYTELAEARGVSSDWSLKPLDRWT